MDVKVDELGRLAVLGIEIRACALGQASAALMAKSAIGKTPAELVESRNSLSAFLSGKKSDPGEWPGLLIFDAARAYTARHAAILLAFEAVSDAAQLAYSKTSRQFDSDAMI